jgi:PKD repeat protein
VAWSAELGITVDSQQAPDVTSSPPDVTSIGVTPSIGTSCTARQLAVNVTGGEGTLTVTWDFADGTVGTGMTVSHRFLTPGTRDVKVSVTDSVGRRTTSTVSVAIAPVSRDIRLRFQIKASDPDALDYIRSVDLDATPIGVPGTVRMRDDGIAGGDALAGDGIYGAEAFVASCEDLQTPVQIKVQDAAGAINTISVVPARYRVTP